MRKFTLIFFAIITFGISVYAQTSGYSENPTYKKPSVSKLVDLSNTPDSGLVAYYPFNGNTLDSTGNNHHSTSNGVSFTIDRFGRPGSAAYFNGQLNSLSFEGYNMESPYSTIAFWVKPDAGTDTIFVNTTIKSMKIVLRVVNERYQLEIATGDRKFILKDSPVVNPDSSEYDFIAIQYETQTNRFYDIIGFSVNSWYTSYYTDIMINFLFPRTIINTPVYYFKGKVDDARIYSRSLNNEEILFLYNEKIKKTPGLKIDSVYFIGHDYAKIQYSFKEGEGADIIDHGICWSKEPGPDTSDFRSGSPSMPNLLPGTTYYVKAFAINSAGIGYSNEVNFTTTFLDFDTIYDIDGNLYKTVKIGAQTWMADNLKTTRYANGEPILHGHDSILYVRGKYYFFIRHLSRTGYYYTWMAATNSDSLYNTFPNGVQGACPNGWHIPNRNDYSVLIDYLGGPDSAGIKMRVPDGLDGEEYWIFDRGNTNESGFSAKGVGVKYNYEGLNYNFDDFAELIGIWSSESDTPIPGCCGDTSYRSYALEIRYNSTIIRSRDSFYGMSVRCIKDTAALPPENNKKTSLSDSVAYNVYPNPASEVLYLTNTPEKVTVTIYDTQSRVRLKTHVTDGKVNIASLPKGIYFIHISDGVNTQKKKFVK